MKRYNLYTFIVCLTLPFLFNACQDEKMVTKKKEILSGIPVGLRLSFSQDKANKVTTKVGISEDAEKAVYDIRVFVFDENKELEYVTPATPFSQEPLKTNNVKIEKGKIASGNKYIYAIANTSSTLGSFYSGNNPIDLSDDDAINNSIKKLSDLTSLTYKMKDATEQRLSGRLVMGGYFHSKDDTSVPGLGACAVDANNASDGVVIVNGEIELVRVDSKIQFSIDTAEGITFVPKKWKVVNMPMTTSVFGGEKDAEGEYEISGLNEFDDSNIEDTHYKGGSFTFYMYENRKVPKNHITTYSERERESDKGALSAEDPRPYKNANDNSAYVVLTGSYSDGNTTTTAEVTYRIHLGYLKGNKDEKANDFDSERNTDYTYRVTVTGVENIILEVTNGEEIQPGAEGSVLVADQNVLVDSHYEARVVTFSNNDDKTISNLSVQVSTPFDEGSYKISNDGRLEINDLGSDYRWIKFVRNPKENGRYIRDLAKYPGNNNAVDVETDSSSGAISVTGDDSEGYLTVDQLLWQLYNNKDNTDFWDDKGEVCYTAFIDEFYYDENPKTKSTSSTLWKRFVNVPNRKMHILCDTKYSPDKQSSLTTSNILINQRSIKTVYNLDESLTNLTTAWGIETVDETPDNYFEGKSNDRTSLANGRYMTFVIAGDAMLGNEWNTYVDFSSAKKQKLQKDYEKAQYACMQRNRDLNGDGIVSSDEIRWYLPALNQYTALWIGKDALDPEARLFQFNPEKVTRAKNNKPDNEPYWNDSNSRGHFHYISSNGIRFWSEQGAATGNTVWSDHRFPYKFRCARNLGFSYNDESDKNKNSSTIQNENYVDYVRPEVNNGFVREVDLIYLNPVARRSILETNQLAPSGEHKGADLNRPYKKFEVAAENSNYNSCPKGWRIPNQREISLIAGYSTGKFGEVSSNTYTDLTDDSYSDKRGVVYAINGNIISLVGTKSMTRCVRDVE